MSPNWLYSCTDCAVPVWDGSSMADVCGSQAGDICWGFSLLRPTGQAGGWSSGAKSSLCGPASHLDKGQWECGLWDCTVEVVVGCRHEIDQMVVWNQAVVRMWKLSASLSPCSFFAVFFVFIFLFFNHTVMSTHTYTKHTHKGNMSMDRLKKGKHKKKKRLS